MARLRSVLTGLAFASNCALCGFAASGDPAGAEGGAAVNGCERTAESMFDACLLDAGDSLATTLANCLNIDSRAERLRCIDDARSARKDDLRACGEVRQSRRDGCGLLGELRYDPDPLLDPANTFVDPNDIPKFFAPNPYVSLAAGRTAVIRAGDEGQETDVVHVTDETREIEGVSCRVVADIALEASSDDGEVTYEPIEVTDDWLAQDVIGNVYYCGELTRGYEDGVLRTLGGSFEAGLDFAKAGALARAAPVAGQVDRQEFALGTAEDIARYENLSAKPSAGEGGENPAFPCGSRGCLKTFEFSPLEPNAAEHKYYLAGVGLVLAVSLEDGEPTGEREELLCAGDSLDVLDDPSCKIESPSALRAALCKLAPDAFCPSD